MKLNGFHIFRFRFAKWVVPLFVLLLCFPEIGAASHKLEKVVLQLKWMHCFQFAGYYMSAHNGHYRNAGLEVEILEGKPGLDVTTQVLSGKADFGVGNSGLLLAFTDATNRGWRDALENPGLAVDLILTKYPGRQTREHLMFDAQRTIGLITHLVPPGYMLRDRWQHMVDTYLEIEMLDKSPNLDEFLWLRDPASLPPWFSEAVMAAGLLLLIFLSLALYFKYRTLRLEREAVRRDLMEQQRESEEHLRRLKLQQHLFRDIHDGLGGIAANLSLTAILAHNEKEIAKKDYWITKLEKLGAVEGASLIR